MDVLVRQTKESRMNQKPIRPIKKEEMGSKGENMVKSCGLCFISN